MIKSSLIPLGMMLSTLPAFACVSPVDSPIRDFYGKWRPLTTASASIVGSIEISESSIRLGNGQEIIIKNPIKSHYTADILGDTIGEYIVTFNVLSKTNILSINRNKLCSFNADKVHMWIEKDTDQNNISGNENILTINFTAGSPSFARLGKEDCETFTYTKYTSSEK